MIAAGVSPYGTVMPGTDGTSEGSFVMDVYRTAKAFPRDETYARASPLRRAAVGFRQTSRESRRASLLTNSIFFLGPARRSLVEVETQLMIAQNLAYFTPEHRKQVLDKAAELGKILNGLISAIMPAA
jgi:four helix bundle protein